MDNILAAKTDVYLGHCLFQTADKTINIFTLSTPFRFDTYRSKKESERLVQYLNAVPDGRILSVAVNDEGSRNLDDTARKAMTKLGSKHFLHLGFRYCASLCLRSTEAVFANQGTSPAPQT